MVTSSCHVRAEDTIKAVNDVHTGYGPRHKYSIVQIGGDRGELSVFVTAEKIKELKAAVDKAAEYLNEGGENGDTE